MSGFIAVGVTLIGLTGLLFTLAIFIQMVLSFPAMLSSNSRTYVQQQRKTYNITADQDVRTLRFADTAAAAWDFEQEQEQEQEQDQDHADSSVERWIDAVDEASQLYNSAAEATPSTSNDSSHPGGAQPTTRGRSRTRRTRTTLIRKAVQTKNADPLGYQSDLDFDTEQTSEAALSLTHDRQRCVPGWRKSMEWAR